jgi:hypothetical protein
LGPDNNLDESLNLLIGEVALHERRH